MRMTITILFAFVARIHAKEWVAAHSTYAPQDSQKLLVDNLVSNLFHRAFQAMPMQHTELDDTTLLKPDVPAAYPSRSTVML